MNRSVESEQSRRRFESAPPIVNFIRLKPGERLEASKIKLHLPGEGGPSFHALVNKFYKPEGDSPERWVGNTIVALDAIIETKAWLLAQDPSVEEMAELTQVNLRFLDILKGFDPQLRSRI